MLSEFKCIFSSKQSLWETNEYFGSEKETVNSLFTVSHGFSCPNQAQSQKATLESPALPRALAGRTRLWFRAGCKRQLRKEPKLKTGKLPLAKQAGRPGAEARQPISPSPEMKETQLDSSFHGNRKVKIKRKFMPLGFLSASLLLCTVYLWGEVTLACFKEVTNQNLSGLQTQAGPRSSHAQARAKLKGSVHTATSCGSLERDTWWLAVTDRTEDQIWQAPCSRPAEITARERKFTFLICIPQACNRYA